ncbi:MAG TPA: Xaa-Pro peptidase family protein [Pirellulaceae bacterium]|nr:Xaa-Pro peptidase family protein [Pirellulaceae bacterium]
MDPWGVDLGACRERQRRLLEAVASERLDLLIVTQGEHVQWLAGPRWGPLFQPSAALDADGRLTLVAPERWSGEAAADQIATYSAKWHSTLRNDQRRESIESLVRALAAAPPAVAGRRPLRIGVEFSTFGRHGSWDPAIEWIDIEPTLYRLRRRKDADELARIRRAIGATGRMYARARELLRPGVSELEMFCELQTAAVMELGEMLTGTGNDYQCASRGGPPRAQRRAEAGELYILDLGPAFRGYFADNCRTLAVTEPTDLQREAWSWIARALDHVERTARPGKRCRELFDEVQQLLDQAPVGKFNHHLGHGIGLFPHEAPHLNPNWDDTLEVGDVFTAEPGLYAPELRAGLRIENDYLVTEFGVERLSDFSIEL